MANNTYISPNLIRTSERINTNWDVINPITKEVIQKKEPEYIEPVVQPVAPETPYIAPQAPVTKALSIQQQIDEAKKKVVELEGLKKLQIEEMKKQLAELEK